MFHLMNSLQGHDTAIWHDLNSCIWLAKRQCRHFLVYLIQFLSAFQTFPFKKNGIRAISGIQLLSSNQVDQVLKDSMTGGMHGSGSQLCWLKVLRCVPKVCWNNPRNSIPKQTLEHNGFHCPSACFLGKKTTKNQRVTKSFRLNGGNRAVFKPWSRHT